MNKLETKNNKYNKHIACFPPFDRSYMFCEFPRECKMYFLVGVGESNVNYDKA